MLLRGLRQSELLVEGAKNAVLTLDQINDILVFDELNACKR